MGQMVSDVTPIESLPGVGSRNLPRLNRLGIRTVGDLIRHFPVRYEDYQETSLISEIEPGQKVNVQGEVVSISSKRIFPRRLSITTAVVRDSSGAIKATWFNQPYVENSLSSGTLISLAGKVISNKNGVYISSPAYEKIVFAQPDIKNSFKHTSGLVPVYSETEGVSSKYLRFLIKPILSRLEHREPLPSDVLKKLGLPTVASAFKNIHFPKNLKEADKARERFAFEDLLMFQLKSLMERRDLNQLKSVAVKFDEQLIKSFVSSLPFQLTGDQKIAAYEILKDLERSWPMNRLMEGDVGSGKTVVALIGGYQVAKSGNQAVFLAPTEVLAQQHYKTTRAILKNSGINTALLTASNAKLNDEDIKKPLLKREIARGNVDIIIGTHAVIQKDVEFKNLALVVVDEQHRFGIEQRAALLKNPASEGKEKAMPHLLSMTATPIPRTLALTIYGDLDVSIIKEKPKNRQKIITRLIPPSDRKEAYRFIENEIAKGRQIFVVCPKIEEGEKNNENSGPATGKFNSQMKLIWAEVKAVEKEYEKLSKEIFPHLRVAMLHGKMKPKEKESIMAGFKNKDYDILVSTSVIEVGVDVPNATVMMIESAERFGLAQLHQFRGRVGRDEHQSYCLLLASSNEKGVSQRLKALVECDDGFLLAEKDMKLRGPGEFMGVKQSGMPDLAMASLTNIELIKKARAEARTLLKKDSNLSSCPLLRERLESLRQIVHFE